MAEGLEVAPSVAATVRERLGLDVHVTTIERAQLPRGGYAAVTFLNVLDQLSDPLAALRRAHELLAPGGALYARVPNGALHRRLLVLAGASKRLRPHLLRLTPTHLYVLERRQLLDLATRAGFRNPRVGPSPASAGPSGHFGPLATAALSVAKFGASAAARLLAVLSCGRLLAASSSELWAHRAEP